MVYKKNSFKLTEKKRSCITKIIPHQWTKAPTKLIDPKKKIIRPKIKAIKANPNFEELRIGALLRVELGDISSGFVHHNFFVITPI